MFSKLSSIKFSGHLSFPRVYKVLTRVPRAPLVGASRNTVEAEFGVNVLSGKCGGCSGSILAHWKQFRIHKRPTATATREMVCAIYPQSRRDQLTKPNKNGIF